MTHPIQRLAPLLREVRAVLREQADAVKKGSDSTFLDRHAVGRQLDVACERLDQLCDHAGAALGLLMLGEDPQAFTPGPTPDAVDLKILATLRTAPAPGWLLHDWIHDGLGLTPNEFFRSAERLESLGLVEQCDDSDDPYFRLTKKGRAAADA